MHGTSPSVRVFITGFSNIVHFNFPKTNEHRIALQLSLTDRTPCSLTKPITCLVHNCYIGVKIPAFFKLMGGWGLFIIVPLTVPISTCRPSSISGIGFTVTIIVNKVYRHNLYSCLFPKNICFFGLSVGIGNIVVNILFIQNIRAVINMKNWFRDIHRPQLFTYSGINLFLCRLTL